MSALPVRSVERDQLFFGALKKGHSVLAACSIAGYARRSVYRWREEDADFEMRWDMNLGASLIVVEEEMRRRAIEGIDVPVFQHGYVVGTKKRYSDSLLLRMWKTAAPDPYGDKELAQRAKAAAKRDAKASTDVQKGNETVPDEVEASTNAVIPELAEPNRAAIGVRGLYPGPRATNAEPGLLGPGSKARAPNATHSGSPKAGMTEEVCVAA